MRQNKIREKRSAAVSIKLDLGNDDAIVALLSRPSGLFAITKKKIIRTRSPDDLDPELTHEDAPWEQSLYLPHGATDPFVARTILQTQNLLKMVFSPECDEYRKIMDVAWELLNSLVSLRVIRERLSSRIHEIVEKVEDDLPSFTEGDSPRPLPIVDYYDIEFRSFVNEVKRALSNISTLFLILTSADIRRGHFHKALAWARDTHGKDSVLAQMLDADQEWIKTWIDMRIAIEHPEEDRFIETMNFSLQADRVVRLPTWRFIHPDYDMARPQNLLEIFESCNDMILRFYEDLLLLLVSEHLPGNIKVAVDVIEEKDRNPKAPFRMVFQPIVVPAA